MVAKTRLTLVTQPQEFFRELLVEAMGNQKLRTREETEFYLVNLLNDFMTTDRLFTEALDGTKREEPLALMLKDALEQPQRRMQGLLFRQLGDVSLYKAGFFHESLSRKLVDVDYYIDMGGGAYQQVAVRAEDNAQRIIFDELSDKFARLVEVFAEVADRTAQRSQKDLLRLYEKWRGAADGKKLSGPLQRSVGRTLEKEGLLTKTKRVLKKGAL